MGTFTATFTSASSEKVPVLVAGFASPSVSVFYRHSCIFRQLEGSDSRLHGPGQKIGLQCGHFSTFYHLKHFVKFSSLWHSDQSNKSKFILDSTWNEMLELSKSISQLFLRKSNNDFKTTNFLILVESFLRFGESCKQAMISR